MGIRTENLNHLGYSPNQAGIRTENLETPSYSPNFKINPNHIRMFLKDQA